MEARTPATVFFRSPELANVDQPESELMMSTSSAAHTTRPVRVALVSLLLLSSSNLLAANQPQEVEAVEAAFLEFSDAFREANAALLASRLTESYVHVNGRSGSVLDRTRWLEYIRSRRQEIERGDLVVEEHEVEDLEVQIYGSSAVVTGIVFSRGSRSGEPFRSRVRFTNLWVEQEGRWRRAAFHDSPLRLDSDQVAAE
jgi:ketosteroid isomerase-like protein